MAIEERRPQPAGDQIIQNPLSFTGSAKRLWPLGRGSHGWRAALRWTGATVLVLLAWVVVLAFYAVLTGFAVLWIPRGIYTIRRRHFIYDARRHGRPIGY